MPWRLVVSIILLGAFLVFIASNIANKCDISFIQWTIREVPIYLTVLTSFLLGMLCAVPVIISLHLKKRKKQDGVIEEKKSKKKIKDSTDDGIT